jgi:CRP-like cAMP-binding protein
MPSKAQNPYINRILSRLSPADLALLQPHLSAVDLPLRKVLEGRGKVIDYIYFPERGFASVVANGEGQRSIEVGLIGREGMTGITVVMGLDRSPHQTFIQCAGNAWRISSQQLRRAIKESATLQQACLTHAHAFMVQTSYTAMANGRSKIEERLARWLLMAHDRIDDDKLPLTHEFLSLMLGVRRPGVTVALNLLERAGLIARGRGTITILDRDGLRESTNGAYGETEVKRSSR